jgi:Kef-type K+ transport system membrane component KefB
MSGLRLGVGLIVMGVAVPLVIFFLLHLETPAQFFTVAATTFLSWGVADLLASILERPRLRDRSPGKALEEEVERKLRIEN